MFKKGLFLTTFLSLFLIVLSFSLSFAGPSSLIIVRAWDDSLWKATCVGTTCTSFTNFPGLFGSQPTVYWDEYIQCYVLWGRASDNTIWRSTFDSSGNFNYDWTKISGLTTSPVGAAGGGLFHNFNSYNSTDMTGVVLTSTVSNILSFYVYAPYSGFFACTGAGTIEHYRTSSYGNDYARVYLTQTSGGTTTVWNYTDVPSGTPTGYTSFPFSVQRWFSVSSGYNYFYLTGTAYSYSGTTTTTVHNPTLTCEYYPYSY